VLGPHADGPLVLAADLRATDWRLALSGIDGSPQVVAQAVYAGEQLDSVLTQLADAIGAIYRRKFKRLRAIAVSVAGTVSDAKLVQFTSRGWNDVDLSVLASKVPDRAGVRLLLGNDATLAGLAEARTGAARSAATALYLIVAQGIGGTLVVNGEPLIGAHGAAGEYGHIPFGDPTLVCPCGARGCWDLTVDGRALARHRGDALPDDPVGYVHDLVGRPKRDARTRRAFEAVAASLGRGTGGLVTLHDPEVVTLGGVAALLRSAALDVFDHAYRETLMAFRIHGHPASETDGKLATQSCTIASGRRSDQISVSRSCEYSAPSTNSVQMGAVTVSSCSMVGRRNCGDVSRTNSAQPPPTVSSPSGGGAIRINRSSNPRVASSPSNDSSMTKTVRIPRSRK
jgi:predicted NBD/HSP70 family sugar kinase